MFAIRRSMPFRAQGSFLAAVTVAAAAAAMTLSAASTSEAAEVTASHGFSNAAALRAEGVPCDTRADACISLSKQEAWLLRDGKVVYGPVRVATGRAGLPTPTGDFHVWDRVVDGWSTVYDAPMPYSVFFDGGDAFHADPVTVRSHGCVHLAPANARHFYRFLHYGALVEVRD